MEKLASKTQIANKVERFVQKIYSTSMKILNKSQKGGFERI